MTSGHANPPHSPEAERALLGIILREPERLSDLVLAKTKLTADHFFVPYHKVIYGVILECENSSQKFSFISILDQLRKVKEIPTNYALGLCNEAPQSLNISHYVHLIQKNYYLRQVVEACQVAIEKAHGPEANVTSFISSVESEFLRISKDQEEISGLVDISQIIESTLAEIELRISRQGQLTGISSGFTDLDQFTGGWQKSDLVILAARPGMGKTGLALNWCLNAVKHAPDIHVAFFTLEMSKGQLSERLISAEGRVDASRMRKGTLSPEEQDRLVHASRTIHRFGSRLMIDETPGITLTEVRARCRRYRREKGLDMIIIDYLQLMSGSMVAKKQNREREIGEISMGLKALAKELSVPVIALAQLNRTPDARPDKRPKISDLRESGSMEQDADQIILVYRDDYYNPQSELMGKAEVLIAKNRHGETGSLFLSWQPQFVSFFNLSSDSFEDI